MLDPAEFGKSMSVIVKDALAPLVKRIEQLEARQPEKGEDGKDAEPIDVEVLEDAVVAKLLGSERLETLMDLQAAESVAKYFEEHPIQHGKDGEPGRDGERGAQGEPGQKGADGKDGAGIADLLIDRDGSLVATMTDGRTKSLGVVVGKDGSPGAPGKDGADFSDASIDFDGERTLTIRGNGGEIVKRLPIPMDRGYYMEGMECEKGDFVTHDGTLWLALKQTSAAPSTKHPEDWRIAARKGRDGRDGKDGKPPPGPVKPGTSND